MAKRRRPGQTPKPKEVNGSWKIWYRTDEARDDSVRRVQKTKVLGRVDEMTYSEACNEAKQYVQPHNSLKPGIEYAHRTVGELTSKWQATAARVLRPKTVDSYSWALAKILPRFGHSRVSEVERCDVEAFLIDLLMGGLSYGSVQLVKRRMKGLFSLAVDNDWLAVSPVRGRFRLGTPQKVRAKTILSRSQVDALVTALPQPYDLLVLLAVFCGLRKSELAGLQWHDFRDGKVHICRTATAAGIGFTKTPGSEDSVPYGPRVAQALEVWRKQTKFKQPDDFVFAIRNRTPLAMGGFVHNVLKPVARKIGIPTLSPHDLRHTFCSLGRDAGVKPEVMQRLMRHKSITTTLEVYSHVEQPGATAAIEGVQALPDAALVLPGSELIQ